jgi:serine/threonine protein kinase
MDPEVLNERCYTDKSDLWSFGAMMYEMLVGEPPFIAKSTLELSRMFKTITSASIPSELNISESCRDLVTRLLTVNSVNRITWDEFYVHPWFNIVDEETEDVHITSCSEVPISIDELRDDKMLKSFVIIEDYDRTKSFDNSIDSEQDITIELSKWMERIRIIIDIGNENIQDGHYDVGSKFFAYTIFIIKTIIETTESYIKSHYDFISEINLMIMRLKKMMEVCFQSAKLCERNINFKTCTQETAEELISNKAISLGKEGSVNMKIEKYNIALEKYIVGIKLFELLIPFVQESVHNVLSRYIAVYDKKIHTIQKIMKK